MTNPPSDASLTLCLLRKTCIQSLAQEDVALDVRTLDVSTFGKLHSGHDWSYSTQMPPSVRSHSQASGGRDGGVPTSASASEVEASGTGSTTLEPSAAPGVLAADINEEASRARRASEGVHETKRRQRHMSFEQCTTTTIVPANGTKGAQQVQPTARKAEKTADKHERKQTRDRQPASRHGSQGKLVPPVAWNRNEKAPKNHPTGDGNDAQDAGAQSDMIRVGDVKPRRPIPTAKFQRTSWRWASNT